jgi:hypothetical protein
MSMTYRAVTLAIHLQDVDMVGEADSTVPRVASEGILPDHRHLRRNRGRKPAKNEGDVFSLLKRGKQAH